MAKTSAKKATTKKPAIKPVINIEAYQKELAALQAKYLKDVDEKQKENALEDLKTGNTKTLKSAKSLLVNTKYQTNIDDFIEVKGELNKIFKDSEPVIFLLGQSRILTIGKLVGYNSHNGDIWVEYKNDKDVVDVKHIKGDAVITDIGKIPVPKTPRASKK